MWRTWAAPWAWGAGALPLLGFSAAFVGVQCQVGLRVLCWGSLAVRVDVFGGEVVIPLSPLREIARCHLSSLQLKNTVSRVPERAGGHRIVDVERKDVKILGYAVSLSRYDDCRVDVGQLGAKGQGSSRRRTLESWVRVAQTCFLLLEPPGQRRKGRLSLARIRSSAWESRSMLSSSLIDASSLQLCSLLSLLANMPYLCGTYPSQEPR
ncbi:hypothetical protein E4T56_gene12106 [Termitomyces sp. T112]|nr:hypothetical protein E4T56_gene12106 [Termitomyces sp. T112]